MLSLKPYPNPIGIKKPPHVSLGSGVEYNRSGIGLLQELSSPLNLAVNSRLWTSVVEYKSLYEVGVRYANVRIEGLSSLQAEVSLLE